MRRRRRPVRLAVWLTALVLVPLTVIGYQLFATASQRSDTVDGSREIANRTDRLAKMVNLGKAVIRERVPTALVLSGVNTKGRTLEQASQDLGGSLSQGLGVSRAASDRALALLSGDALAAQIKDQLTVARKAVDDPKLRANGAGARAAAGVRDAQSQIELEVLVEIGQLDRQIAALTGDPAVEARMQRDLQATEQAFELMIAFADQGAAVFAIGGISDGVELTPAVAGLTVTSPRVVMVMANAYYRISERKLEATATGVIADRVGQFQASGDNKFITTYLDKVADRYASRVADQTVRAPDFDVTAFFSRIFLASGLRQLQALNDLITVAGEQVEADARSVARNADDAYRQIMLITLGVALAALLGVALLSRVVSRPLAEVATRARRISNGDFGPVEVHGGPREVTEVSQAFDDVVGSLRLLQTQAAALAGGDTADESLQQTAPGALGEAIQASVSRLSQSLDARKRLEDQLRHESTHDGLTGLLNRAAALVALENSLARVNRVGGGLGVIHINLDKLHTINDVAGPAFGDEVLRSTASTLSAAVRTGDVVARLGSDEFVVVAETTSVDVLMDLSVRIIDRLGEVSLADLAAGVPGVPVARLRDAGLPTGIGASAGVVVAFDGLADATALLRDAASAVRVAKRRGGGSVELLDDELRQAVEQRKKVHEGLRQALDAGDLRLQYQPIVDMDGRTRGVEALTRWTSSELGVVRPDIFVAAAESSDLVLELDRWVLKEALHQLAEWDDNGHLPGIYLSVNISGRHLGDHRLVEDVTSALRQSGVAPQRLLLEVTETVLLDDLSIAARELSELRGLGIRVAVDDFGTGYTSIAHLQQLPVDIVKIDRSFIVGMAEERGLALVRMMVEMASVLGLSVVAEGVETPGELEALREMGCPLVQGFLLGRPAEPDLLAGRATSPSESSSVA